MDRGGGPTRVLRAQQPLQHSLVVTVSVIMTACLALMYMLVSRHLASMDQIALALTESISEQTTNQAVELKALVAALENHTYSVAAAVTDHVAVQTVQLRQLAAELRNHSHFVREHVGQHVDQQQAQLAEVLAELRARMGEVASAVMAPPAPPLADSAITTSNLTLLVAAGLRSQRRTEQAVGKLVTQVGRLAARDEEEGGLGTETLREVVSAVKKHMQLSRSLQ
ncbi:unnamed protein product, partial [Closterium sp. NIES-54]